MFKKALKQKVSLIISIDLGRKKSSQHSLSWDAPYAIVVHFRKK